MSYNLSSIIHKDVLTNNKERLPVDTIICGDCEQVLKTFPDKCIDLIVTSPPYADRRKKIYVSVHPDEYIE